MTPRNYGVKRRTIIAEIAPDIAAAIGPVALAEIVAGSLFLAMMFVWFVIIGG